MAEKESTSNLLTINHDFGKWPLNGGWPLNRWPLNRGRTVVAFRVFCFFKGSHRMNFLPL